MFPCISVSTIPWTAITYLVVLQFSCASWDWAAPIVQLKRITDCSSAESPKSCLCRFLLLSVPLSPSLLVSLPTFLPFFKKRMVYIVTRPHDQIGRAHV